MTNTNTTRIDRCSGCDQPAHASETDDNGRCVLCQGDRMMTSADACAELTAVGAVATIWNAAFHGRECVSVTAARRPLGGDAGRKLAQIWAVRGMVVADDVWRAVHTAVMS